MEYVMILNAVSVIACSAAIATVCKVTGSAWPLLAFILIPKWGYHHFDEKEEKR
jgi:hypothetical protein